MQGEVARKLLYLIRNTTSLLPLPQALGVDRSIMWSSLGNAWGFSRSGKLSLAS
jgi:hypothetical protein